VTGRRPAAVLATALLALGGCGVPTSGEPEIIPASDVPYGLASRTPDAPSGSSDETMIAGAGVYLVTPEDVLAPRGREVPPGSLEDRLESLLGELAIGPTRQELAEELSTSLPPEVELDVTDVTGGTVTIDIAGPVDIPSGAEGRLGVGQIVLTATSLPQVFAVRLAREGELVEAPLPDGELTSEPLTAQQFASFLTAAQPTVTPAPSSATTRPAPTASPTS
jgi:Sporulation and spore germination